MDYQDDFSAHHASMFDDTGRRRKAITALGVMQDHAGADAVSGMTLLNVGSSTGIMDDVFAQAFQRVEGIDIDAGAVAFAQARFTRANLHFGVGDAMAIPFPDGHFDAVVCSQVYEHVPDQPRLMREIARVLRPGGFCYFACTNRYILIEPHYRLPLLSWLPPRLADAYLRRTRGEARYYERMRSYAGLLTLVSDFRRIDYTASVLRDPMRFGFDYLIRPGSAARKLALLLSQHLPQVFPGYLWILVKPTSA